MTQFRGWQALVGLMVGLMAGCARPAPQEVVHRGMVDVSGWAQWIEGRPEVLVVRPLDEPTRQLLREQEKLFGALVAEDRPMSAAPAPDLAGRLEALKRSYPAKARQTVQYRTASGTLKTVAIDVPSQELWDKYRRRIEHASLTNLRGMIVQLEMQRQSDRKQFAGGGGSEGMESRTMAANLRWLDGPLQQLIAGLKELDQPGPGPEPDQKEAARAAWREFEGRDLPVLQRVLAGVITARAEVDGEGRFAAVGDGELLVRLRVAGRDLFFRADAQAAGGGVRVFGLERTTRPVP